MAGENNGLDSFLTTGNNNENTDNNSQDKGAEIDLEDEFAKLLNDFVNQGSSKPITTADNSLDNLVTTQNETASSSGLDNLISEAPVTTTGGLDNFISDPQTESGGGLDGLVTQQTTAQSTEDLDSLVSAQAPSSSSGGLDDLITEEPPESLSGGLDELVTEEEKTSTEERGLKEEEYELAQKIKNFQDSMTVLSMK